MPYTALFDHSLSTGRPVRLQLSAIQRNNPQSTASGHPPPPLPPSPRQAPSSGHSLYARSAVTTAFGLLWTCIDLILEPQVDCDLIVPCLSIQGRRTERYQHRLTWSHPACTVYAQTISIQIKSQTSPKTVFDRAGQLSPCTHKTTRQWRRHRSRKLSCFRMKLNKAYHRMPRWLFNKLITVSVPLVETVLSITVVLSAL